MDTNKKIIILLIYAISLLSFTTLFTNSRYNKKIVITDTIITKELKIEFEKNGDSTLSKVNGSIVNIVDTHSDYLVSLKYVWALTNNTSAENGTEFTSGDNILNTTLSGTYYLCVYALDDKGFYNNTCSNAFNFDNTAPTVAFTYEENNTYKHSQSSVVTVTNDEYGAELDLNSIKYVWTKNINVEPNESFTSGDTLTKNTGAGDYYLIVNACDSIGNCTKAQSNIFKIDNEGPEAILESSSASDSRGYINYTATDNESGIVGYSITTTDTEPTEWIPVLDEVESTTEVKQEYGATWARIFHHNNKWGEIFFANSTEALSSNTLDKYSDLNDLEKYKLNGKFEFLLQYPDVSDTQYNRWIQTANPTNTTIASGDGSANAPGYEAVHIDWTGNYWGGLVLANANTATYIDGSVGHGNWFYAIGAYEAWNNGIPGPNSTAVSVANLWTRIDGLTGVNKKILSGRLGDIKEDGTYYVWFKDELGNVSRYEKEIEIKSILKINPNGGLWNGKTTNSVIEKSVNSFFGIPNPTRTGYTFSGWTFNGGGSLLRGNSAGTASSKATQFTETVKTDTDGSQYTNYKYTNVSTTSTTWPSISYPNYAYTSGHRYRITVTVRLNTYDNLGYLMFRHSAFGNDWGGTPDYASFNLTAADVGKGWKTVSMERTFTGTTINRSGTDIAISPRFEIYSAINANTTASVDFDIKNIVIEDITNNTLISTNSNGGYVYKYGSGNGLLTANWTLNNYTVTCEDWFVDASNNRKVKLGSSTKTYAYGTSVSGTAWGTDGTTSKYYSGYAYKSATSGTVPANNNLVVYRYFYAWTNMNIYYAGSSTENGATVSFKVGNGSWTDVTNESNTVQPYGTTYYVQNIRPKNSYEELDRVQNLTWNSAGYYTYTPTAGGTSMNIYMKYKTYTISYNLNGGSVSGNPTSYNYSTAAFTLKNPTRSGYTFTGWTGTGLSSASTSVTVPTHSTGNRSYTANWRQNCTFTSKEFNYTGGVQSWQVPTGCDGNYKLEVYGAQGGNRTNPANSYGGKGGYATGTKSLSAGTTLYIVVGGQGTCTLVKDSDNEEYYKGGYNGGGGSYPDCRVSASGGGATHIATTNRGELRNYNSYRSEVLIVAGGGGGFSAPSTTDTGYDGGTGGGTSGGAGAGSGSGGGGGTSSAAGSSYATNDKRYGGGFGYGGGMTGNHWQGGVCGGGGGWFGGGNTDIGQRRGCGGGSGYVGGVSSGSTSNGQRSGNGYAKITKV